MLRCGSGGWGGEGKGAFFMKNLVEGAPPPARGRKYPPPALSRSPAADRTQTAGPPAGKDRRGRSPAADQDKNHNGKSGSRSAADHRPRLKKRLNKNRRALIKSSG